MARTLIERSDHVTILADSSKFERRALMDVCSFFATVDRLVTDREPPRRYSMRCGPVMSR